MSTKPLVFNHEGHPMMAPDGLPLTMLSNGLLAASQSNVSHDCFRLWGLGAWMVC